MIIDIHTHTFPDKIADSAIAHMEKDIVKGQGFEVKCARIPTLEGLSDSTKKAGIDLSVVCPVATNTRQPEKINRLSAELNESMDETKVFHFGAVHPDCENYKEIIDDIVAMELKGIKLHPDYQNTFFDDEKYIRIVDYAANKGLGIIVHAGEDVGLPDTIHCTPDMVLNLWKHIQPDKLILAHMGGWRLWDEVEEKIIGLPVYLDTAVVLNRLFPVKLENEQFQRMVKNHGADKILYGTDSPWYNQMQALEDFENSGLSKDNKELILGENANKLFHFI
ncbi:amidohydrolase family protein [uncultured Eubacterium sp.]|uniref:amidohydrolase family protein n=1 Tax=uncultured Eubacterium sp. TaxID=165185 RepID=UPI0026713A16|nr:amidohydrolase family protein [uncultured Eubacterium sp.]